MYSRPLFDGFIGYSGINVVGLTHGGKKLLPATLHRITSDRSFAFHAEIRI